MSTEELKKASTSWKKRNQRVAEHRKTLFEEMNKHLQGLDKGRPRKAP